MIEHGEAKAINGYIKDSNDAAFAAGAASRDAEVRELRERLEESQRREFSMAEIYQTARIELTKWRDRYAAELSAAQSRIDRVEALRLTWSQFATVPMGELVVALAVPSPGVPCGESRDGLPCLRPDGHEGSHQHNVPSCKDVTVPYPAEEPETEHTHDWFSTGTDVEGQRLHLCRGCSDSHHPWGVYGGVCDGCDVLRGPDVPSPAEEPE